MKLNKNSHSLPSHIRGPLYSPVSEEMVMCQLQTFHLEQLRVREDACLMHSPNDSLQMGRPIINAYILFIGVPRAPWICAVVHLTHSSTLNSPIPFSPHPGCVCESQWKRNGMDAFMAERQDGRQLGTSVRPHMFAVLDV